MNSVQLIDAKFYSEGFPRIKDTIERKNILSDISNAVGKNDLIFINGQRDSGKSIGLAQYVKDNKKAISIFFRPLTILDYRLDYFYLNFNSQACYLLGEDLDNHSEIELSSYEFYTKKVRDITKKWKNKNVVVPIVIDGLEQKFPKRSEFIKDILIRLPYNMAPFKIVITGNRDDYLKNHVELKKLKSANITIPGFSQIEIKHYLGLKVDSDLEKIFDITKGLPGRLSMVKEMLDKGMTTEDLTTLENFKVLIEHECSQVNSKDQNTVMILSVLSLENRLLTIQNLADICQIEYDLTASTVEECPVLQIEKENVVFLNRSYREYFKNEYRQNKDQVFNLLIDYYARIQSFESLERLPDLYTSKEKWEDVIRIINKDAIIQLVERTGSLSEVNNYLDYGVNASQKMNNTMELWKFSLEGSIVNELDNYLFWESEIEALMAVGDDEGAINLANTSILTVDKLSLLSLVAKHQKEKKSSVDSLLEDRITKLYEEVDFSKIGSKVYDIVSNLIYALPNLAISIIENSEESSGEDISINDWITAKLSLSAIESSAKKKNSNKVEDRLRTLEKLGSEESEKINRAIRFLVSNYEVAKVISEVRKLSDSIERLKLIRLWLSNYKGKKDVTPVIELGINELISSGKNPDLDDLVDLTKLLPTIKNPDKRKDLYFKIKQVEKDVKDSILIKSKYKYQLNMFNVKFTYDKGSALIQLDNIFNDLENIEDQLIQVEIYAEIYSILCRISSRDKNYQIKNQINRVYGSILNEFEIIFNISSYHEDITDSIIQVLAKENPKLAFKIIKKVNIRKNRQNLIISSLESYLENNIEFLDWNNLNEFISIGEKYDIHDQIYLLILERIAEEDVLDLAVIIKLIPYFDKSIECCKNINNKSYYLVQILKIISLNEEKKYTLSKKYLKELFDSLDEIDSDWLKIDFGFKVCSSLPGYYSDQITKIFKQTQELKQTLWLDSSKIAYVYLNSIKIIVQCFTGLIANKSDEVIDDLETVSRLIDRIPSKIKQLEMWCECCFGTLDSERTDLFDEIMDRFVEPRITEIAQQNAIHLNQVPNFYILIGIHNAALKQYYINKLPNTLVEKLAYRRCRYLITKENPYQPYDSKNDTYATDFGSIIAAIEEINLIKTDLLIKDAVELICNSIQKGLKSMTQTQITEICSKLDELVNQKLPDVNNILHDGYLILCRLHILKIKQRKPDLPDWEAIFIETKNIPNKSDQLYVSSRVLEELPNMIPFNALKENIISNIYKILNELKQCKIHFEYVHRVLDLNEIMYKYDKINWEGIILEAFNSSQYLDNGPEGYIVQKKFINSIYHLNENYAKELVNQLDESHETRKKRLKDHYKSLEVTKKIKKNETLNQKEISNRKLFTHAIFQAWKSLNSNLITPRKLNVLNQYLSNGNKAPLHDFFPVFSYYLANCRIIYRGKLTGNVSEIHEDNFKMAVEAAELIEVLLHHKKMQSSQNSNLIDKDEFFNQIFVPGDRLKALDYIRSWMEDNLSPEELTISDPYFSEDELDILKLVLQVNKSTDVKILSSQGANINDIEEKYITKWEEISEEEPPQTNIVFCWYPNENSSIPFHDRYIISKGEGLRLGSSINGYGARKITEISVMRSSDINRVREEIFNEFLPMKKRTMNGEKLRYKSFTL